MAPIILSILLTAAFPQDNRVVAAEQLLIKKQAAIDGELQEVSRFLSRLEELHSRLEKQPPSAASVSATVLSLIEGLKREVGVVEQAMKAARLDMLNARIYAAEGNKEKAAAALRLFRRELDRAISSIADIQYLLEEGKRLWPPENPEPVRPDSQPELWLQENDDVRCAYYGFRSLYSIAKGG